MSENKVVMAKHELVGRLYDVQVAFLDVGSFLNETKTLKRATLKELVHKLDGAVGRLYSINPTLARPYDGHLTRFKEMITAQL